MKSKLAGVLSTANSKPEASEAQALMTPVALKPDPAPKLSVEIIPAV